MNYRKRLKRWGILGLLMLCGVALITGCNKKNSDSGDNCQDGVCVIPTADEDGREVYAIVSPVGYNDVEKIEQAERLDTLEGKTIALVGGSFNASVTHNEIKKCIEKEFPSAKIYTFNEVGSGGPFSVFGQSEQTKKFQEKLKELKVDAVISGNCGCGLCTTKETGSAIAAEYIGIPTVTVGAKTFVEQIHSTGVNRGVPVLRTAEYPGAFSSDSTEELRKNAREVLWPQIKKGLTEKITAGEIALYANDGKRPADEIIYYGNYDEIQEYCRVNGWTDGLPVVPPTDEKIREYLKFTPYKAEDVLGTYALAYRECTVYTVAANAVMAGVPKEYMPICIAFTKCLQDGEWRRPLASTHGWTPFAWLNGPLARQLGIDHEQGMISEENNKALGRFIDLAMLNMGGYYVKENRMGTFGYLTPWTFSEDEETCVNVGWEPYHVTKCYGLNDNTLTAGSALEWGNNVTPATDDPEQIMTLLAWDITEKQQNGLGNTNPQVYRTVFITEEVARDLAKGYPSKTDLEKALIETARRPLYMRAYANYWANTGSKQFTKYSFEEYYNKLAADPKEQAKLTDTPEWLKGVTDEQKLMTIATMNYGETPLLITGDNVRNKFQVMPGGGYVTFEIELPENWNELVAPLGYEPLETYYLAGNSGTTEERKPAENSGGTLLPMGTYRLVASLEQLSEEGRIYLSDDGILTYWAMGDTEPCETELSEEDNVWLKLLNSIGVNSSLTLTDGVVNAITLRPSSIAKKNVTDASGLTEEFLNGAKLTLSVNLKKSKEAGAVTPGGTTVILSGTVRKFTLDLSGAATGAASNTKGFMELNGAEIVVNPEAPAGAKATFGVQNSDGTYRTFTFTKTENNTIRAEYNNAGAL